MTPVDVLARAIAGLALAPRDSLLVANLSNPNSLSLREFFQALGSCGLAAVPEPTTTWQQRLAAIGENNALAQLKGFYEGDLSGDPPPTEQTATLAALAALDIDFTADYEELIPLYVDYLKGEGFLP
jgi:hypothetical protein